MSEQILSSTTGGLLSLNLSVLPQGASPGQAGGSPLFTGFGSILNQHSQGPQALQGLQSGASLPSEGAALPQLGAISENLDDVTDTQEFMRQQMLQVALMLEQQKVSGGEIPAELSAELARALKEYVDQRPVLPTDSAEDQASQAGGVVDENAGNSSVVDGMAVAEGAVVSGPVIPLEGVEETQRDVRQDFSTRSVETHPNRHVQVLSQLDTDPAKPSTEESIRAVSTLKTDSSELSTPQSISLDMPESVKQSRGAVVTTDTAQEAIQPLPQSGVFTQEKAADDVAAKQPESVVASVVSSERSTQKQNGAPLDQPKSVISSVVSEAVDADAVTRNDGIKRAELDESLKSQVRPESPIASVKNDSQKSVDAQSSGVKTEPLVNAKTENSSALKFESMLEMTQQLLQKVTAGEKTDNSATQLIEKIANSSSVVPSSTQSLVMPTDAQKTVAESQNLMMPQQVRMNTPAWNNALGERAVMIAAQNTRVAEIQLDPPELGSLHVRVNVNQDQVSISFTSPHAHVREAVEQSLPRLREMFAEQGLALQDSSVSDHSSDQQRREQYADESGKNGQYGALGGSGEGESIASEAGKRTISLVDYYA